MAAPIADLDVSRGEYFQSGLHHALFKRLRAEDPVHYSKTGPSGPYWSVTRHEDIVAIDTNHEDFSSNRDIVIGDQGDFAPPMFIAKDPPVHDVQRKAAMPAVAPTRLADLEALMRARLVAILDGLPVGEPFDWVDKVSIELTTQMLATLFDFPWEDRRLLPYWSDVTTSSELVGNYDMSMEERHRVLSEECLPYFARLWAERAAAPPKFDFISLLAHDPGTADMMKDPMEFLGNLMLLIVGGNDTTRNSISGGVFALNQYPDEFEKLKRDPSLIPNMVSEVIRWQTPLAHMRRTAARDVEFKGRKIAKGDRVVMWYVSGNRDEAVFDDPDRLIIDRPNARRHVAFGFGIHRCMGNRVAEMQLRILWEELLKRYSRIEVVGPPKIVQSNFVLGYQSMPVRLHA
ncbi:MAG: cytochrome P450 [Parvularculaceae bacterium]|nr:cytochrome P450 [Parvularculaceae bacterium]